ncbi:NmrA family NAD(P)-binding protein [Streptomyces sp. NPDC046759]|uniref:NmrA family NAD(P)-binding protein n=1 Tax=Streptomyces sp. NPDC046759 TaxID=3155019 RepID=UPI0033E05C97
MPDCREGRSARVNGPILVLGATGGQGGAVTDALVGRHVRLRAPVRDPLRETARELARRGVELVAGSLRDRTSLAAWPATRPLPPRWRARSARCWDGRSATSTYR